MAWATAAPIGFNPLPELYVRDLARHRRLHLLDEDESFLGGSFTAHLCPGHTPGCLVYAWTAREVPVLFSGDAAKNRAELLSMSVDMTMDAAASRASLDRIWSLWRAVPGTLLIPGHDLAMRLGADGRPEYVGERRAGIAAWFAEDLAVMQSFDLAVPRF
jgi:glyoxylase-like metal-dependent hydrolase (beta-lactamase superfamily II)